MQDEITIDGTVYVPKYDIVDGMEFCIVRTINAGVFAGYIKDRNGDEITLVNSRRLWKWVGAATLSELANLGVSEPNQCKFPDVEPLKHIREWIEIIPCSNLAKKSIEEVPIWTAR